MEFLARCGADGIISTRAQLIRFGKECGLMTVQRFFALDSQGVDSIGEVLASSAPDLMELMPGVVGKLIRLRYSADCRRSGGDQGRGHGGPALRRGGGFHQRSDAVVQLNSIKLRAFLWRVGETEGAAGSGGGDPSGVPCVFVSLF